MEVEDGKSMYEVESRDGTINRDFLFSERRRIDLKWKNA